jgi:hypothetical protein
MKLMLSGMGRLLFLLVILAPEPVSAQTTEFQVLEFIDVPYELGYKQDTACQLEFREQWTVNPARSIISKKVNEVRISCAGETEDFSLPEKIVRLNAISYEFSFLDPHNVNTSELQGNIISLILRHYPGYRTYNLPEELLSVYFHEKWILEPDKQTFTKIVEGITPVIWQQRKTVSGEPVNDAETGLPVYYIQELERIDLRIP